MYISDQHLGIKNVVGKVYRDAHHGLCNYHLGKNFKNRFKHEDVVAIFTLTANCYKEVDFNKRMNQLNQICKDAYDHLMKLRFEKWTHAWSLVRHYKLMKSNIVECINSCLGQARKIPITVLIECIRGMFQHWFHERHKEALNLTTTLSLWAIDLLNIRFNEACHFLYKHSIEWSSKLLAIVKIK